MIASASPEPADHITILSCSRPLVLTKTWQADGTVKAYGKAKHFSVRAQPLANIEDLSRVLAALEGDPQSCVIRGSLPDGAHTKGVLRRKGLFEDRPHHWFLIEVDGFSPDGLDPVSDPEGAACAFVRACLPEPFLEASYHWQLSCSAGRPEKRGRLYIHLWFWSETKVDSEALKRWSKDLQLQIDASVFDTIQAHYTAAPIFEPGVDNPVPRRSGFHAGRYGGVTLEIPTAPPKITSRPLGSRSHPKQSIRNETGELDERGRWLQSNWRAFERRGNGALVIACPFETEHSGGEAGDTATVYFPASASGSPRGAFKCLHNACSGRSLEDFDAAVGFQPPEVLNPKDHSAIARYLVSSRFTVSGDRTLIRSSGEWFEFDRSHYISRTEEDIRSAAWRILQNASQKDRFGRYAPLQPSSNQISSALDALRSVTALEVGVTTAGEVLKGPIWLDGRKDPDPRNLVVLENGVLDLTTRELSPHSPRLFSRNALPYAWTKDVPQSGAFLAFLEQVFDGDQEQICALQEVFGYLVSPYTSPQKITLILGPSRSGKGTLTRVLKHLVGPLNVASPTLQTLSEGFGLQPLLGKSVAILSDVRNASHRGSESALQNLLMVSGEDSVTVNRKNLPAWTGELQVRFLMTANELPRLTDTSDAMLARLLLLKMPISFEGREDPHLTDRLLQELPGVLTWALDGLDRLRERRRFVQPAAGEASLESYRRQNNPIRSFLEDCCVIETGAHELLDALYSAYRVWAQTEGRHPAAKERFSASLTELGMGLERRRPRIEGQQRTAIYGLRLADHLRGRWLVA